MPNRMSPSVGLVIAALSIPLGVQGQAPLKREDAERSMGLRSQGDLVRGQLDTVGFVVTREQAEDVVPQAIRMGEDAELAAMPWAVQATLEVKRGPHNDNRVRAGVVEVR